MNSIILLKNIVRYMDQKFPIELQERFNITNIFNIWKNVPLTDYEGNILNKYIYINNDYEPGNTFNSVRQLTHILKLYYQNPTIFKYNKYYEDIIKRGFVIINSQTKHIRGRNSLGGYYYLIFNDSKRIIQYINSYKLNDKDF